MPDLSALLSSAGGLLSALPALMAAAAPLAEVTVPTS
jgi:hypothetical protein